MRLAPRPLAGSALALLAALLAGCGAASSSNGLAGRPPAEIVAAARTAAANAATVHVVGSTSSGGTPVGIDMELVRGKGGQGRITVGALEMELIRIGPAAYVRGNGALYQRVAGREAGALQGRWLKVTKGSGDLFPLLSLSDLPTIVDAVLAGHGELANGPAATVEGRPVLTVRDLARGGTLYVAATGAPYPLEARGGAGGGLLRFERWNGPIALEAPTDVTNVKQLDRPVHQG